ncbi:hypothetical protein J2T13_005357 [Paenibacillus sp. DS2015]
MQQQIRTMNAKPADLLVTYDDVPFIEGIYEYPNIKKINRKFSCLNLVKAQQNDLCHHSRLYIKFGIYVINLTFSVISVKIK